MRLVLATALVLAVGCGGDEDAGSQREPGPATELSIVVRDGAGGVKRATLRCGGETATARGFLRRRNARRLCARAQELRDFLATQPDPERVCTQIYGSAHTARIRGHIASQDVNRRFHRSDGCGIADWRRARMLLGGEPSRP